MVVKSLHLPDRPTESVGGGGRRRAARHPLRADPPQYATLVAIDGAGAVGTMTGLVDRLAGQGLVERRCAAVDRRVVLVRLTAAGEERLAQVEALRRGRLDAVVAAMGEPAVRGLIHLLDGYRAARESDATQGRLREGGCMYGIGTRVIALERAGIAVGTVTAAHEGERGRRYTVRLGAFPDVLFPEDALARYTAARYDTLARGDDLLLRAFRAEDRAPRAQ